MKFLFHYAHDFLPFRIPELNSLLALFGVDPAGVYDQAAAEADLERPFLVVELPSAEIASKVAGRGILITAAYEVWGEGATYEECIAAVKGSLRRGGVPFEDEGGEQGEGEAAAAAAAAAAASDDGASPVLASYFGEDRSWSMGIEGFGRKFSMARQQELRGRFSFLPFRGPVRLKPTPAIPMVIMEEVGLSEEEQRTDAPKRVLLLRRLGESSRELVGAQSLKRRTYLGPTSMENEMSLLMANQGLARRGSRVLDPFVGTGSLLISASNFGAQCTGWDIDTRVLKGIIRGKRTANNVWSNFDQYGLPRPEIVRCDLSMHTSGFRWPVQPRTVPAAAGAAGAAGAAAAAAAAAGGGAAAEGGADGLQQQQQQQMVTQGMFDAIICDPPYGIRAGARRAGSRRPEGEVREVPEEHLADHIAQTKPYAPEDVMADLLALAARALTLGGRLVYLLPSTYDYTDADLPTHPCLRMVANSEQPLTLKYARRLLTMEKVEEFFPAQEARYAAAAAATRKLTQASYAGLIQKIEEMNAATRGPDGGGLRKKAKRELRKKQGKQAGKQKMMPVGRAAGGGASAGGGAAGSAAAAPAAPAPAAEDR